MRLGIWLMAGSWTLAIGLAAMTASADEGDGGGDRATTRAASKVQRGERGVEPRQAGRAGRGDDRRPREDWEGGPGEHEDTPPPLEGRGSHLPGPLPGGDRRGGPLFGPSPERIERVMEFLEEQYPKLHERLSELRGKDARSFHRQMNRIMPRMPELMAIIERDPKLGKLIIDEHRLEMEIRDAVIEHRRARGESTKADLKQRVRELISKQFDVRQEKLKLMIADMERELERKKQFLSEQAEKKERVIEHDLQRRLEPEP